MPGGQEFTSVPFEHPSVRALRMATQAVASQPTEQAKLAAAVELGGWSDLPTYVNYGLLQPETIAPYGELIAQGQAAASREQDMQTLQGVLAVGSVVGGAFLAPAASAAAGGAEAASVATAAGAEGAIVAAESGAIAAGAELALMPAAVIDTAAIAAASPTLLDKLGAYAISAATKVGQSLATSYLVSAIKGKPPAPTLTVTTAPPMALTGGNRTMFEDLQIDWSRLGDVGIQLLVNQLSPQPSQPQVVTAAAPMAVAGAIPSLGGLIGRGAGAAAGLIGGAVRAGAGIIRTAGGRIAGWVLGSGQRVTRKQAVSLAKQVGITAAAGALGASAEELAEAVMQEEGRGRRRRGITARDLTTTRRTIGRLERAHRQIAKAARAHTR